jgi:hypothetical protein
VAASLTNIIYMECKRCLLTSDIARINKDGICEYCELHDRQEFAPKNLAKMLLKIKAAKRGKYDCLIGISGGFDSAILLHQAKAWGLSPLVIHFDNHYNTVDANYNIEQLVQKTGVDFIRYYVDKTEYDAVQKSLLMSGTPDGDILNDLVMTDLIFQTAEKNRIKYILNGHNYRTEGSSPRGYTYMDAKYLESIHGKPITLPIFRFKDQIRWALLGIKQLRPFHEWEFEFENYKKLVINKYLLKDYGKKHGENIVTDFVGSYYLPIKFGIDKSIVYLSAQIRSNTIQKKDVVKQKTRFDYVEFIDKNFGLKEIMNAPVKRRSEYDKYNFKRYRLLVWVLVKMGSLPYTFYLKYCK